MDRPNLLPLEGALDDNGNLTPVNPGMCLKLFTKNRRVWIQTSLFTITRIEIKLDLVSWL